MLWIDQHDTVAGRERCADRTDLDAGGLVAVVAQLWNEETLADAETGGDRGEPVFAAVGRIDEGLALGRNLVTLDPRSVHIGRDRVFGSAGADARAASDALGGVDEVDPAVAVPVVVGPSDTSRRSLREDEGDDHASCDGRAGPIEELAAGDWNDRAGGVFVMRCHGVSSSSERRMGIVAIETCVGRELAAVGEHVFAGIDLRKFGGARIEPAVAELTQLAAAAHRHFGQHLSFLELDVEGDRTVTQLALHRSVNPGGVVGVLDVVAHCARIIATVANRFVAVFGHRCATVRSELAPGFGDKERSSEDHGDQHGEEQDRRPKDVLGVGERTLRLHGAGPPWWTNDSQGVREDPR
jgi:hypothetical protein